MKRIMLLFVLIISLLASAQGATISYNTGLTDPPGTYFGSGNTNTNWAVSKDDNGLELGLRAHLRFIGDATAVGGHYYVPLGDTTAPGKTGSAWGIGFSGNTNYLGTSDNEVSDKNWWLQITDENTSATLPFDPSLILDNSLYGSTGFQNATSLHFNPLAGILGYNSNNAHTYRVDMWATSKVSANRTAASDPLTIYIHVGQEPGGEVPEPATWGLMGAGLTIGAFLRRRKKA